MASSYKDNISNERLLEKRLDRSYGDNSHQNGSLTKHDMQVKKSRDLLLVGYLGGGTTFMGDILGSRNNSFYLYEPLYSMAQFGYFKPGHQCSMTGGCRKNAQIDDHVLKIVHAIFSCEYDHFNHNITWWQTAASKISNDQRWEQSFLGCNVNCSRKYLSLCSQHGSIVSKMPRISIGLASKLLNRLPNLKIVHLLRDPRAIMNSRKKYDWTPVPSGAISLCYKMFDDVLEAEKVKTAYPTRLYTVYYEDMVMEPLETFEKIYNFTGYNFDANEKTRILDKMQNSTRIAKAWRNGIDDKILRETNKACTRLYPRLGYPQISNLLEIKNMSIPLRNKVIG
ncbi:carbohydrate sulfotransferase 4-like [Ylistrum balloti]|uniref:carbohydrate sulfotransferase 4-like n=1 Tax=Ylistrum balloti TaxID=509963 RepID=UPI0029057E9D|nr:carbohydrate sulfotransferase 4-like [Ylistrum balloti]